MILKKSIKKLTVKQAAEE